MAQRGSRECQARIGMAGIVPMTLDRITIAKVLYTPRICGTQDWEFLLTLDGGERGGKSSVMADILLVQEPEIEKDILSEIYESFEGRYAWSWTEWYELLKSSTSRAVIREEADFLGRESMTEINRRILRILTTVGRRNNKMGLLLDSRPRKSASSRI